VALRAQLTPVAIDAFVEYAVARGARRDRLRVSWHALRDLIGNQRAVLGSAQLGKHKSGAIELARELGKLVDTRFDVLTVEITTEMLEAIDAAVLHLVRNAVDHGIELPEERLARGKAAAGKIHVHGVVAGDHLKLTIADDGRGVSFADVQTRAAALGLVGPDTDVADRWLELVCQPGFTTRAEASDISGRGVGLDAVRAGVAEVGGLLTATTVDGGGTSWTLRMPLPHLTLVGHVFRATFAPVSLVLDETWRPADPTPDARVLDVGALLGLADDEPDGARHYMTNGELVIALVADRASGAQQVRRLIVAPPPAAYEVVTIDTMEGLLVHPERIGARKR
jgi:two-component system chemotaxis sensor kinase CheA